VERALLIQRRRGCKEFLWDWLSICSKGLVFLVTGLQMRTLLDERATVLLHDSILAVLLTVVVVMQRDLCGSTRRLYTSLA